MSSYDKVTAKAYAGLLAAASAVAAKRAFRRPPGPGPTPRGLRVASVQDAPHFFEATHDSPDRRIKLARFAAASLLYTVEKKPGLHAERVLAPREREIFHEVHKERCHEAGKKDLRCRYCHLSNALISQALDAAGAKGQRRFVIVRHSATVKSDFNPDTFVSSAGIKDFQILVPREVAFKLVARTNPLTWHDAAPKLFLVSTPAVFVNGDWQQDPNKPAATWEKEAEKEAYLFERVAWSFSADAVSEIENSIRISNLRQQQTDRLCSLRYDYDLESCLDSNFAIIREGGGLDVDAGQSDSKARHPDDIGIEDVRGLTERDIVQLDFTTNEDQQVSAKDPDSPPIPDAELKEKAIVPIQKLARKLGGQQDPWWLVTVTANKRLRFTAPGNTPVDLWATLTWLAPALVFNFVNEAVCLAAADLAQDPAGGPQPNPPGPQPNPAPAEPFHLNQSLAEGPPPKRPPAGARSPKRPPVGGVPPKRAPAGVLQLSRSLAGGPQPKRGANGVQAGRVKRNAPGTQTVPLARPAALAHGISPAKRIQSIEVKQHLPKTKRRRPGNTGEVT